MLHTFVLALAASGADSDIVLADPVPVHADGAPIDVGADIGHAGPQLRDLDGDGKPELLVSAFRGSIHVYRNVGDPAAPRFARQGYVTLAGAKDALKFHNW